MLLLQKYCHPHLLLGFAAKVEQLLPNVLEASPGICVTCTGRNSAAIQLLTVPLISAAASKHSRRRCSEALHCISGHFP